MSNKRSVFILLLFVLLSIAPCCSAEAASYMKIKMNGSVTKYSGTQVKAMFGNEAVDISATPGITVNGIALLPYDVVFKSGLGADCSYNSKKKEITVKQYGNTVKLTLDSKIAYVNGTKVTAPVTPRKIYYYKSKTTKIMIPSRFVAEALGYTYNWSSSTSTVKITEPYTIYYGGSWHLYKGTKGKVTINGTPVNVSNMPGVILDGYAFVQGRKVFGNQLLDTDYTYNSADKTITIRNDTATIVYTLNSTTATVNDKQYTLKVAPKLIKDNITKKNYAMVPAKFTAESLGYQYIWNKTTKTSQIKMTTKKIWSWTAGKVNSDSACTNTLQSIVLEKKDQEEYISLSGKEALILQSVYAEDTRTLTLTLSNLNNKDQAVTQQIDESSNVERIHISECETGNVTVSIVLKDGAAYYESTSGHCYDIHFCSTETDTTDHSITLVKPENVDFSEITDTDCYYNKQFKITLPGDYVSYYQNIPEELPEHVAAIKCSLTSAGSTVLTFTTSKVLGYRIKDNGDTFTITVGDPSDIYDSIVVLDAGHGGTDPGCISNGYNEKDINYNILYKYAKNYFNDSESPVKAYWTRTTDTKIALTSRAAFAKSVQADLFISLHMNSAGASANGAETYYCTSNNTKNSFGVTSKMLASYFQYNWPSTVGIRTSRGIKTANYVVIKQNTVPAILIELGFMTNTKDIGIIGNTTNQKAAAKSFYQTVCDFFKEYPTGR